MTQEDKELLLKDLSARLPYGVIVNVKGFDFDFKDKLTQIYKGYGCSIQVTNNMPYGVEQVKPYLFPMSSMTEEQRREYTKAQSDDGDIVFSCAIKYVETGADIVSAEYHVIDWLNAHHFDYRGLIPKGLANDATNLGIY